jgi:hypothetical protein
MPATPMDSYHSSLHKSTSINKHSREERRDGSKRHDRGDKSCAMPSMK